MFTGRLPFEHKVRDNLGFTLERWHSHAGVDVQGRGLRDWRLRFGVCAASRDWYRAGIRRVRRDVSGDGRRSVGGAGPAARPADARGCRGLVEGDSRRIGSFFSFTSTSRTRRIARRSASRILPPTTARSRLPTRSSATLFTTLKARGWYDTATIVVLCGSRRGPGRPHRGRARAVPLRRSDPRAVDHAAATRAVGRATRARSGAAHRPAADAGGARAADSPGRASGPRSFGRCIRPRHSGAAGHLRRSPLSALSLRLERAAVADRRSLPLHQGAARGTVRPRARSRRARQHRAERGQAATALRSALDALVAGRDIDAPSAVSDDDRQRLAALGYVGTQSSASPAAGAARSRADPKDKAPLLRTYRQAVDLIGEGRLDEGTRLLREILDDDPAMTDVWSQYAAALGRHGPISGGLRGLRAGSSSSQPDEPNGPLGASSMLLAAEPSR